MSPYEEYAVLDSKIRALIIEKDKLKADIIDDMMAKGEDKKSTAVGNFTVAILKTWTYSPIVAQLEDDYKTRKAIEESNGDASFIEKPSLRFIQVKL
jgi:hypothetical protein